MANVEKGRRALEPWTRIILVIAIIGALNWGLIGIFNFNLVDAILGGGARETTSALSRVIYAIVGVCGVLLALLFPTLTSRAAARTKPTEIRRPIQAR